MTKTITFPIHRINTEFTRVFDRAQAYSVATTDQLYYHPVSHIAKFYARKLTRITQGDLS